MQLNDDCWALLNSVLEEWNKAEADIKIAEQVAHKVVNPSIKELRYAGRRIVDSLLRARTANSQAHMDDIASQLHDALFDCHRARHDAIDAGTSKIAIDLDIMTRKLGYEIILPFFPEFPKLYKDLRLVRTKIIASRRDRSNREMIYSVVEAVDFPALVESYHLLMENEEMMKAMARKRRRSELWGVVGTVIGIIGVALAVIFWYYPRDPSNVANTPSNSVKSDLLVPKK
jgi:hypothetical protein